MFNGTSKEMTDYLSKVVQLESSIYDQEQTIYNAETALNSSVPKKDSPQKPKDQSSTFEKPQILSETILRIECKEEIKDSIKHMFFSIFAVIFGVVLLVISPMNEYFPFLGLLFLAIGIGTGCMYIKNIKTAREKKENIEYTISQNQRDIRDYEEKVQKAKDTYNSELRVYELQLNKAEETYKLRIENFTGAKKEINRLYTSLEETKNTLTQLYALDYIFPKYRNFVAMCTMYEYFVTGRVSTLDGPNGAYNLYEQELRQNLIIGNLENIGNQLTQIKENQYTLYTELNKTNAFMSDIVGSIQSIEQSVYNIDISSAISARCAEITALNTTILTNL